MRSRSTVEHEIEELASHKTSATAEELRQNILQVYVIELLLDIRELLAKDKNIVFE